MSLEPLDLKPMAHAVGVSQMLYASQYKGVYFVCCAECGGLVGANNTWHEMDGSLKHLECLSDARLSELASVPVDTVDGFRQLWL